MVMVAAPPLLVVAASSRSRESGHADFARRTAALTTQTTLPSTLGFGIEITRRHGWGKERVDVKGLLLLADRALLAEHVPHAFS